MEIYQIYFRVSQKVGMAEGGEDLTSLSLFLSLAVSVIIIILGLRFCYDGKLHDDNHHHRRHLGYHHHH